MSSNTCDDCKWLQDEVCTNSDSEYCADYPVWDKACDVFEPALDRDEERYKYVLNNIQKDLLHTRWSYRTLENHLKNVYDIYQMDTMSEDSMVLDYGYVVAINEDWGYMNIYYLLSPFANENNIYITEIYIAKE